MFLFGGGEAASGLGRRFRAEAVSASCGESIGGVEGCVNWKRFKKLHRGLRDYTETIERKGK